MQPRQKRPKQRRESCSGNAAATKAGRRPRLWQGLLGALLLGLLCLLFRGVRSGHEKRPGIGAAAERAPAPTRFTGNRAPRPEVRRRPVAASRSTNRPAAAAAARVGPAADEPHFEVLRSTPTRTELVFRLGPYRIDTAEYRGRPVALVRAPGAPYLKQRDAPALPCFRGDVILAAAGAARYRVVDAQFEEVACAAPMPAGGFVSRAAPDARPAPDFGPVYGGSDPYPADSVLLTEPYRIRHVRGIGVRFYPFQYRPESGTLLVCTQLRLEITTTAAAPEPDAAALQFPAPFSSPEFAAAARRRFLNFREVVTSRAAAADGATAIGTGGGRDSELADSPDTLLVVVPDALEAAMAEFVTWKRQRGLAVSVARYPTDTGTGSSNLAAYIAACSDTIASVILVGDHDDIPVRATTPNPSDTLYTLVSGDDAYHDLLLSRISCQTEEELTTQLAKILTYERDPTVGAAWYSKAAMVASDQMAGNSAFGLLDKEHLARERAELLAAGFTWVGEIYDPGAASSQVVAGWNGGRSLFYYLGHGTETTWSTSNFRVSDVETLLHNGTALPFVVNGNCRNGNFTWAYGDCLAEAMMKAGTAATPAGSIGTIAATTNMDWDPPIVMLQAFTDYLTDADPIQAGAMTFQSPGPVVTAGGLTFFSIQRAMDYCYNTPGVGTAPAELIMEQTHLLGDCTLSLRTLPPVPLTVTHPATAPAVGIVAVVVTTESGTPVAAATVSIYSGAGAPTAGRTDANGQILLPTDGLTAASVVLTVTHRNAVPYQIELPVSDGALTISTAAVLPVAVVDEAYAFTHAAIGGVRPYTWALVGPGPAWLSLDPDTGTVSGTPAAAAVDGYTIRVTDQDHTEVTQTCTVNAGTAAELLPVTLPSATVSAAYTAAFTAQGSFPPFGFAHTNGVLPPGLVLAANGTLSGTPTTAGDYTFTITVTDQQEREAAAEATLRVAPAATVTITTATPLPNAARGAEYLLDCQAGGGSGSGYLWSVGSGTLPPGMTLSATGQFGGTPVLEGTYLFSVLLHDDWSPAHSAQKGFSLTVSSAVYFPQTTAPDAYVNVPYSATLPVGGSDTPFTFSEAAATPYDIGAAPSTFTAAGILQPWRLNSHDQDNEWELDLGFPFPFFGTNYSTCRVGNNGYLTFAGSSAGPDHWNATPERFQDLIMVAPFWTDLVVADGYPQTGIFVASAADRITIRWQALDYHFVTGESICPDPAFAEDIVNVAVTLYDSGRIEFHYGDIQTSNRIVVGICNGTAAERELVYDHTWEKTSPDYISGWSGHDDVVFTVPRNLPAWLTLSPDGSITGTPPTAGTFSFTIQAEDAAGNTTAAEFTLQVLPEPVPDADGNGDIDNREILEYVEHWAAGHVSEAELVAAIELWRSGRRTGGTVPTAAAAATPVPVRARTGEIRIVLLTGLDQDATDALVQAGYDVAGTGPGQALLYATPPEVATLRAQGYTPILQDTQWVGPDAPPAGAAFRDDGYHDYAALSAALQAEAARAPNICRLVSIGRSVAGRELWAVKISDAPDLDENEPECKIVGTIHGDESLGAEVCLDLIERLVDGYGAGHSEGQYITALVDSTEIWIVPCMNPDGLDAGTRYNANGIDLNRAFPDGVESDLGTVFLEGTVDTTGIEPEAAHIMTWGADRSFVLSVALHTGALLVCYPYGNNAQGFSIDTPTADDALFEYLARSYARNNPDILGNSPYADGIINGADWYCVTGEMADWNYRVLGTFETTAEISTTLKPAPARLPALKDANRNAMLAYLANAGIGARGMVTNAATGTPLRAEVRVTGVDHPMFTDPSLGDYHRPLLPGTYTLDFAAPGFWTHSVGPIAVSDGQTTTADAVLVQAPHATIRHFAVPRFQAGETTTVLVAVQVGTDPAPNALLVTEQLPQGWSYVADSTWSESRAPLANPRVDGNTCSWLFRGDEVGTLTFSYQVAVPVNPMAQAHFEGQFECIAGVISTGGDGIWQQLRNRERLLFLAAGWNLFSVPLRLDAPETAAVFRDRPQTTVWCWTGTHYLPALELQTKEGYWAYSREPDALVLAGSVDPDQTHRFQAGWNLFGPLQNRALPDAAGFATPILYWDNGYQEAVELRECRGYWIYSNTTQRTDLP